MTNRTKWFILLGYIAAAALGWVAGCMATQ
jgi:hypothetical protein